MDKKNVDQLIKERILALESELVPLVRKKLGRNLVTLFVAGGCSNFEAVAGWSDYDCEAYVNDMENVPEIDLRPLEKRFGIKPIQLTIRPIASFRARVKGSPQADRYIDNLWIISLKTHCRILAGRDVRKLIPPIREILKRDLGCELRGHYMHATNPDRRWNVLGFTNPKRQVNAIVSFAHIMLLAKGLAVKKSELPQYLVKYYPDFAGTSLVVAALKVRAAGNIPVQNSPAARRSKALLIRFLKTYQEYFFFRSAR